MGGAPRPELAKAYRSLLDDMHLALLSEIGARSAYAHLARVTRDEALGSMLVELNAEGAEIVSRVQELMQGMGRKPRRTSFRRRAIARGLALSSRMVGARPALRLCQNAEETVSRWYGEYAIFLIRIGDLERARVCEELAEAKRRRGRALGAWISNLRRG